MAKRHRLDHDEFLVKPGSKVRLRDKDAQRIDGFKNRQQAEQAMAADKQALAAAQELLWASKSAAMLVIFQAMDAAGKDGTIKHVMSGVNPQGVDVTSFRAPTDEERLHHFLWRPSRHMPARGRIAIFNRSYYEEVLVVRVHPEFLGKQYLPPRQRAVYGRGKLDRLWQQRYADINEWEDLAIRNGVEIVKFFLQVSNEEQRSRFMDRLEEPDKQWKFEPGDFRERQLWPRYMKAYEDMLEATSTAQAPWYVIPADRKWFMRAAVADVIVHRIEQMKLQPPTVSEEKRAELATIRAELAVEAS